jgi:hypothetical protein
LGFSFPVTDKTGFRLSYSHQLQSPSFAQLASGVNKDVSLTNTNDYFARPLAYGKTIMFEFGIRHAFNPDMVLDISAYNKDALSNIAGRILPVWDPLTGKIQNSGLIEVPMGIQLKEVIYDIGGGIEGGKKLKAVQTGGPSGGCIPASIIETTLDYESLGKVGSIMGSGGIVVIDDQSCMVDTAKFFVDFCVDESCGKCTPCRVGLRKIQETYSRIIQGEGKEEDVSRRTSESPIKQVSLYRSHFL